jgi:4-hydroxy-3-methylbut-2-enyl diphosphate reductase
MKIEKASEMGFCFGVRRAIDLVEEALREKGTLESLGPIIHNRQVVERLISGGLKVLESPEDVRGSVVAIPSHGMGPEVEKNLKSRGIQVVDTTCPFVRKAQIIAQRLGKEMDYVLIFGDCSHPEVRGVLAWAGKNAVATLESPVFDAPPRHIGILSQTTQSLGNFSRFLEGLIAYSLARVPELHIFNTICDATARRQSAALELARKVDIMIVVGGQHSANTRRLAEICASSGVATYHVETAKEIDASWFLRKSSAGITAGASTPDWIVDDVISRLKESD